MVEALGQSAGCFEMLHEIGENRPEVKAVHPANVGTFSGCKPGRVKLRVTGKGYFYGAGGKEIGPFTVRQVERPGFARRIAGRGMGS